jgi:cell division septum initiation protein DivIVA
MLATNSPPSEDHLQMAEQPSAPEGSSAPAPKRATTRRRASAGRRATSSGTSGRATTRRTKAASTKRATAKRATTTTRKRATAKTGTARKRTTAAAGTTAKRRGRPPGSRNKRATPAASNPADAMSKRISDLISENRTLKARVNELEAGWKKIERALGSEVTKARRTVKRTTRAAARKVEEVVNAVT